MPATDDNIRLRRARSQHLLGERLTGVAETVRAVAGIQAQDPAAAALSIRARTAGLTRADVDRALYEERSVVRLWAMRGTIHLVPAEDAAWLVDLLGPLAIGASRRRLKRLGVPAADVPRAIRLMRDALAAGDPLTRAELMEPLAAAGIETGGQAAAHLPMLAALDGLVCFGPPRGGKPTYVLRDSWLGAGLPRLSRERALAELAGRYVRAFGPAEPEDFAWWSGLPLRDARAAWPAEAGGAPREAREPAAGDVRLLPAFDTYLLGYRSREFAVPAEHAKQVAPGGGIIRPTVMDGGRAVGVWRRRGADVELEPFPGELCCEEPGTATGGPFAAGRSRAHSSRPRFDAGAEVADVRRFLGPRPARARSSRA